MRQINKLFELRSFLILWSIQAVSSPGIVITNFTLIIWVYKQDTASSITLLSVYYYLPSILFCLAAGTLTDIWDKKKSFINELTR